MCVVVLADNAVMTAARPRHDLLCRQQTTTASTCVFNVHQHSQNAHAYRNEVNKTADLSNLSAH